MSSVEQWKVTEFVNGRRQASTIDGRRIATTTRSKEGIDEFAFFTTGFGH
jgi:hypothetical protein